MNREYTDFLRDMLENAQRAIQFTKGMDYKSFAKDDKTVYAVIRAVEIIGEAAANIPEEVRSKYPNVPWREVKGLTLRNIQSRRDDIICLENHDTPSGLHHRSCANLQSFHSFGVAPA